MKIRKNVWVLLMVLGIGGVLATACQNTAKGVQKDYQKAEDKVENAVK